MLLFSACLKLNRFALVLLSMHWCYWLIMIVQLIEQGQVVSRTGPMIKDSGPFYWILLKEVNLFLICGEGTLGII